MYLNCRLASVSNIIQNAKKIYIAVKFKYVYTINGKIQKNR